MSLSMQYHVCTILVEKNVLYNRDVKNIKKYIEIANLNKKLK